MYIKEEEQEIENKEENSDCLYVENLKLQTKIKALEKKIVKLEGENGINDTHVELFLKNEVNWIWDNIGLNLILEHFLDFFFSPIMTFNLIQEMFVIISNLVDSDLSESSEGIINIFGMKENEGNKIYIRKHIHKILVEKFKEIFETEEKENNFYDNFIVNYKCFYKERFHNIIRKLNVSTGTRGYWRN